MKRPQRKSIVSWLTRWVLIIILFQTLLIAGTLVIGGVLNQAKDNAYQAFHEKVNSRKEYLQREMKNKWTNIDPYINDVQRVLSSADVSADVVFGSTMDTFIDMLRTTQVSGVYLILDQQDSKSRRYPALYIRDYDPLSNNEGISDIYMICGPSDLAKAYRIPLDQTWQYSLAMDSSNEAFYKKPLEQAHLTQDTKLVGYWSEPFKLSPNDVEAITYSRPVLDSEGKAIGVIGVEITLNNLLQYFPSNELQPKDSLGYLLAKRNDADGPLLAQVAGSALQKRMIDMKQPLDFSPVDLGKNIYKIPAVGGKENIYANVEKMGLYQSNTPFEKEQWYLVGFMREDYLFNYVTRIETILQISIGLAVVTGIIGGVFISYQMTKPITSLVRQVQESEHNKTLAFSETGFQELDKLASTIELANQQMLESASRLSRILELTNMPIGAFEIHKNTESVFVTDQIHQVLNCHQTQLKNSMCLKAFQKLLDEIQSRPEPEEQDVYLLPGDQPQWVRLKTFETDLSVIGVITDVTDEILDKQRIRLDRDLDPLTKLFNRKGFQWRFENWYHGQPAGVSALVMFDLDNLKQINDAFGHQYGDYYILKAVESLKKFAPEDKMLLGRRSGDEFVLLLHGFASQDEIRHAADNYYEQLNQSVIALPDGSSRTVSISAGIKWIEDGQLTYDELLHYADEALYASKYQKKGSYSESR